MAQKKADVDQKFAGAIRKKLGMEDLESADSVWAEIAGSLADAVESLESLSETVEEMEDSDEKEDVAGDLAGIERNLQTVQQNMARLEKLTNLGQEKRAR